MVALLIVSLIFVFQSSVWAKEKLRGGVLYSLTGAFALAGAEAGYRGCLMAMDMWNEKGGIQNKYELVPGTADVQSNPDVAIREAKRLIAVEKVPIITGVYSSVIGVPSLPSVTRTRPSSGFRLPSPTKSWREGTSSILSAHNRWARNGVKVQSNSSRMNIPNWAIKVPARSGWQ